LGFNFSRFMNWEDKIVLGTGVLTAVAMAAA